MEIKLNKTTPGFSTLGQSDQPECGHLGLWTLDPTQSPVITDNFTSYLKHSIDSVQKFMNLKVLMGIFHRHKVQKGKYCIL